VPKPVVVVQVGERYFETLGLSLVRGRAFTAGDGTSAEDAAIINQRLASLYFPNEDPIGRQIAIADPKPGAAPPKWATIVGVSPAVRQNMGGEPNPVVYFSLRRTLAPSVWLMTRAGPDGAAAISSLRDEVRSLDPDLPLFGIATLDHVLTQTLWPRRAFTSLFVVFAAIALTLSTLGLYAVTAYLVTQRTQEVGVRMALGAEAAQVRWLILRGSLVQLATGFVIGAIGAFALGRLLGTWLVQTQPLDPRAVLIVTMALLAVCVVATFVPVRAATRIEPMAALRYE
jgi:putative ABC transport system permease protein